MARTPKTPDRGSLSPPTLRPDDVPLAAEVQTPEQADFCSGLSFPIVGIGASAGGLAAFEAFFSSMPANREPGMAFVLVQHLAPDHKSILSELIRRYTRMEVFEIEDGVRVQRNCAYIIPPNHDLAFIDGRLHLLEPAAPRGQRLPIDFFFRTLAQDQHERAIGIVFSGTGSDGTLGVRAIKGEGGMVMVQHPESTEYDGMPRSAISTGLVDFVLPPAEMPAQLMAYATHAFGTASSPATAVAHKDENALKKILVLLRTQTNHDFSQYKQSTILRRIERRMALHQIGHTDEYVRYLQQQSGEVEALFGDLLIGVTRFFRDEQAFAALEESVIPQLFAGKEEGSLIRVWVPGCSSGEEAYSIAILLQEHLEARKQGFRLQVYATDIDRRAIDQARAGLYPGTISADISPERLSRYFVPEGEGAFYRIQKRVRDVLIFSEQDLLRDPPFSKLDLLSCRNVLIYLDGQVQKRLIPLFHYALNPGGMLFLGSSETVGEFTDLFAPVDQKARIYQCREEARQPPAMAIGGMIPSHAHQSVSPSPALRTPDSTQTLQMLTEQALLAAWAPVAVLVDAQGDILFIHGRTGQYLEPPPGAAQLNILKMAREGLHQPLVMALHQAAIHHEPVHHPGLRVRTNGDFTNVDLRVQPVVAAAGTMGTGPLFLVILAEVAAGSATAPEEIEAGATGEDRTVTLLRQELRAKEEYLQATTEELQTANEELRSANEELQSVNEELQSTNEELETSKEELQSINEELTTVNAELQQKVTALTQANNDLSNLLAGTGVGTIFVDHHLHIRRFTPQVAQVINLIPTDVGRPLGHLVSNLVGYDRFIEEIQGVLDTLVPRELEVQTRQEEWFLMRIRPYRTLENMIEGAVITFFDITERKAAQEILRKNQASGPAET